MCDVAFLIRLVMLFPITSIVFGLIDCWIVKHPVVMTMFGVPKAQVRLIVEQYPSGVVS